MRILPLRSVAAALLGLSGLLAPGLLSASVAQEPTDTVTQEAEAGIGAQELYREASELRAPIRDLLTIYRRMDGLRDVRVHLEGGVLEISGTALTAEAMAVALEAAERVPDIIWVDNRLAVEPDFRKRLAPAWERMEEKGVAFLRFLPTLLVGLVIVAASVLLAIWVGSRSFPFQRIAPHAFAGNLLRQAVRAVIVLVGALLALDLMAATALVGAVLGAAGLLGIAVGFAFRDIVENYLAGVLLSLRQPFAPNDHLQLAEHEGRVVRLTGRETILMTLDGNHVRIPNATVYKAVTTNFTRNPRRRFLVKVSVAPWEDLSRALGLARSAVASVPGVLEEPRVSVRVHELGDSAIELRIFGWVDQTAVDFGKVRSQALRAVKETYEREGVATPPPEYGIRILDGEVPAGREAAEGEARPGIETPEWAPASPAGIPTGREGPSEAPPVTAVPLDADISPDTTIQEEIARELAVSEEENLLRPAPPAKGPDHPPPPAPSAPPEPPPSR